MHLFRPYWAMCAAILVTIVVIQLLIAIPTVLTARIIDVDIPKHEFHSLAAHVGLIIGVAVVASLVGMLQFYCNSYLGESIMRDLRTALVEKMHRLPMSFFTNTRSGVIMNRVSGDADAVEGIVTSTLTQVAMNGLTIVSALVIMFAWNWRLALVSIAVLPVMLLPVGIVGKSVYARRKQLRNRRDDLESLMQQTLSTSGIGLVKSFCREIYEVRRFRVLATKLMKGELRVAMAGQVFIASTAAMMTAGPALLWLSGGWMAIEKTITVGTVVAFVGLIMTRLYGPAGALLNVRIQLAGARAVFERIFEYAELPEEATGTRTLARSAVSGQIRFENVRFAYGDGPDVLRDISLTIEPGQTVALVGTSGCGKSTLAGLLSGFYRPTGGRILIDGVDISLFDVRSLRRYVGIVSQDTYLFHDSIAANLRYAKRDATAKQLVAAAASANIDDFIQGLPAGYETVVGDRGHRLSGGQRQRIALARILLKDPAILILDEATSALDEQNEGEVQAAMAKALVGRTSIVITHRMSAIAGADRIVVLDGGRIAEGSGRGAEVRELQVAL